MGGRPKNGCYFAVWWLGLRRSRVTQKEPAEIDRLQTGVEGLDTVLNGGLLRGAAYIIHGPPGAGKTILSNQICFGHTQRGEVALYVSLFAESHDRMMRFMQRMGFYLPEHVPERLTYISAYSALRREGLPGVLNLLAAETRRRGATLVIFDGLFVAQDAAISDQAFREFVHELQGQAAFLGATLLLLTNQRRDPSSPEYTMVDGWIELHDETHTYRAVRLLEVHKQRGGSFLRGRHLFRITNSGVQVFPRVEAFFRDCVPAKTATGRTSWGIEGLDTMFHGGLPKTSSTLIYGPSGAGKTTFGLHFISQATPQSPALFFGFYETPDRLIAKAASIGIDLAKMLETGALRIIWRSLGESHVDEIIHHIVQQVVETGAQRLFIDGLHSLKASLIHEERLPLIVNALLHRLQSLGVTVVGTLVNSAVFLPADLGTAEMSTLFNNVLLLHYARREGTLTRNLSILKVRDSDYDPIAEEFHVCSKGIVFGQRTGSERRPANASPDPAASADTGYDSPDEAGRKDR